MSELVSLTNANVENVVIITLAERELYDVLQKSPNLTVMMLS